MKEEEIISLVSLIIFLITQTSLFAYYFGKMSGRMGSLIDTDEGIKEDIGGLAERMLKNNSDYYLTFETKDAVEDKVAALKESVLMFASQNSEQHSDIKENYESIKGTLEKMNNCLHKLDKAISSGGKHE